MSLGALFIQIKYKICTFEIIFEQLLIYVPHLISLNQYKTQQVHTISAHNLEIVRLRTCLHPDMALFTIVLTTVRFEMAVQMIKVPKAQNIVYV